MSEQINTPLNTHSDGEDKKLFDNKVTLKTSGTRPETEVTTEVTALESSPVKAALRSHIERWYPETAKKNKLEVDDMLETA